jgi:hypothetical protein
MEVSGQLNGSAALLPGKEPPLSVGSRAGLDMVSKIKIPEYALLICYFIGVIVNKLR